MQKKIETLSKEFFKDKKIEIDKNSFYKEFYLSLSEIKSFSTNLYNFIIIQPEITIEIIENVLSELLWVDNIRIRFVDYDKEIKETKIRDIRAKDIGKIVSITGYCISASDVRPQIIRARFECEECGTIIVVNQTEKVFKEPTSCSCGNKNNLKFKSQELADFQRIIIAENNAEYEKNNSPKISVFLSEGLTDPERKVFENIGKRVSVIGILREVRVDVGMGKISTRLDLVIEANNYLFV